MLTSFKYLCVYTNACLVYACILKTALNILSYIYIQSLSLYILNFSNMYVCVLMSVLYMYVHKYLPKFYYMCTSYIHTKPASICICIYIYIYIILLYGFSMHTHQTCLYIYIYIYIYIFVNFIRCVSKHAPTYIRYTYIHQKKSSAPFLTYGEPLYGD